MRRGELIAGPEPCPIATGPERGRIGRPDRRLRTPGRMVALLAASIGLAWLPLPDHPPEILPARRARGNPGSLNRGFALSPDGQTIAMADCFGLVTLRSAARGGEIDRSLDVRGTALAFAPDGRCLVVGGLEYDVVSYDLVRGGRQRTLGIPVQATSALRFSPDGRTLAVSSYLSCAIILWDIEAGRQQMTLRGHSSPVVTLAFAPDGRSLGSTARTDGTTLLWDLETGRPRHRLTGPGGISLAFSPDGRRLAVVNGGEAGAQIWDARTGRRLRPIGRHSLAVRSVSFSPDGRLLATAAGDGTVGLWSVATGREVRFLGDPAKQLSQIAFSPDGRTLVATGNDDDIRIWDLDGPIAENAEP